MDNLYNYIDSIIVFILSLASTLFVYHLNRQQTEATVEKTESEADKVNAEAWHEMQGSMIELTEQYKKLSEQYVASLKRITDLEQAVMERDGRVTALEEALEQVQQQLERERKARIRFQKGVDILIQQLAHADIEPVWKP